MNKIETIKPATLAQAKKITEELKRDFGVLKTSWYDLAKRAEKARLAGVHHALGISLDDWIGQWAEGGERGRSTIYDWLKIVRELSELPEATVKLLDKGNALELTKLPKSKRLDENWVRKAKNMSTRDFQEAVRSERGEKPLPKDDGQEFRKLAHDDVYLETYEQIIGFRDRMAKLFGFGEDKRTAAWAMVGAFLHMVEDRELKAFAEGVSEKEKKAS